jgi:hypothetical protein
MKRESESESESEGSFEQRRKRGTCDKANSFSAAVPRALWNEWPEISPLIGTVQQEFGFKVICWVGSTAAKLLTEAS